MVLNCQNSLTVATLWEGSEKASTSFPVLSPLQHPSLGEEQLAVFLYPLTDPEIPSFTTQINTPCSCL